MTKLYFCNNGYMDADMALTFGVSAKESNDAIGQFGTGLKYAISIILRLGGTINITSKGDDHSVDYWDFDVKEKTFRGKTFNAIYCNDEDLKVTTHYGYQWKPWMAFRELYSNCLDEGGEVFEDSVKGEWDTIIEVDCWELVEAYNDRCQYFLDCSDIIHQSSKVTIYVRPTSGVYLKGIYVGSVNQEMRYTYDFKSGINLSEDRAFSDEWNLRWNITDVVKNCSNPTIITEVLTSGESYEYNYCDWEFSNSPETFLNTALKLHSTKVGIPESCRNLLLKQSLIGNEFEPLELTPVQQKMLGKAVKFLTDSGFTINDYKINVVTGLGDGVVGRAYKGEIYLSEIAFTEGTKSVAPVLLEEWLHLHENVKDFDYKMQTWLFNKVISLCEELNGEPL
jgi:hypothetical protein